MNGILWTVVIQGVILFGGVIAIVVSYGELRGQFTSLQGRVDRIEHKIDEMLKYLLHKKGD